MKISFILAAMLLASTASAQMIHIEIDGHIAEAPVFSNEYAPWIKVNEPEIKVMWRLHEPVRPLWTGLQRSETCRTFPVQVTPIMWSQVRLSTENIWVVVR